MTFTITQTPQERFWSKVQRTEGCWNWVGAKTKRGYGSFLLNGLPKAAHRVAYQWTKGDIPNDKELDHICNNKGCVNPDHLRPITHLENVRRAFPYRTHCKNGHPLTEDNLSPYYLRIGRRKCSTCIRDSIRRYAARHGNVGYVVEK